MTEIKITQSDLNDAENFLTQYMTEKVPEASFEKGSATRDILVKGFTYLYAYIRGEVDFVTARQSLLRIQSELTDADDISQAVDEILSNFFVSRKDGDKSRVNVRLHFTETRAYTISLAAKFYRTSSLAFSIDSSDDPYVIAEDSLFPVFDNRGVLIDYIAEVGMKAAKIGTTYNIEPGTFVRIQVPGGLPYFSYAENTEKASDGLDVESSTDLVARAPTAISVRNLVNNRSIDVTLQEQFPAIKDTLSIGMGEPEMRRDVRNEFAPHITLHVGGHYDTYVDLPLVQVEENGTIGGYFARPDRVVNVFRDPAFTIDAGQTFDAVLGIVPGNILYVVSGILDSPRAYQITRVTDHELEVSESSPFTEASDELDPNLVNYSIGNLSPGFDNLVAPRNAAASVGSPDIPFGTSRHIQASGKILLSGRPVQQISRVELTDPDGTMTPFIDTGTGTVMFYNQTNSDPLAPPTAQYAQYQTLIHNPSKAQSMDQVFEVNVGFLTDATWADGFNLRVSYLTPSGFEAIDEYVKSRDVRILAANHLMRVRHPTWIEMVVEYRMKATVGTLLDVVAAAQTVSDFVNTFNPQDDLDTSDIATILRTTYPDIGAVYPLTIYYRFYSPDGQMVYFSTTDIISIFMDTAHPGVTFLNPGDVYSGSIPMITAADLRTYYNGLGVSDRTVQYRTTANMITFVLKA